MYRDVVESYMARDMTFPGDILHAFNGVAQILHTLSAWDMPNGIVTDVLDYSLLWRPKGVLKRRFKRNGDPRIQKNADELAIPTYSWAAWSGPVTYHPMSFALRSLVTRFETVAGERVRQVPRHSQNSKRGKNLDLEPPYPLAPQDCSTAQDFGKTLKFIAPQARHLAFKMHLVNDPKMSTKDGPSILQFKASCAKLLLSTNQDGMSAQTGKSQAGNGRCQIVPLLNMHHQRAGFVWHVPLLDQLWTGTREVEVVLLSKYKATSAAADSWLYDFKVGDWHEWCLINVLLVKRLSAGSLAERVTIGKIHDSCGVGVPEELVRLV